MRTFSSLTAWVVALGLALAGPVAAERSGAGDGALKGKDLLQRTVTIDRVTYRVLDGTRIEDLEGRPLTLSELPLPDARRPAWMVEFEFDDTAGAPSLRWLRLAPVIN